MTEVSSLVVHTEHKHWGLHGRNILFFQLSEADDVYTTSLLADSQYDQADVLILGGGDGALLAHLVHHHQPRQVTMVELDGAVMRVVRDHMHSVTRGVLDSHTSDSYNIITAHW